MSKTFRRRKPGKNKHDFSSYFVEYIKDKIIHTNFTEEEIQKIALKLYHSDFFANYYVSKGAHRNRKAYNKYVFSAKRSKSKQNMHVLSQYPSQFIQHKDLSFSEDIDCFYQKIDNITLDLKDDVINRYW